MDVKRTTLRSFGMAVALIAALGACAGTSVADAADVPGADTGFDAFHFYTSW